MNMTTLTLRLAVPREAAVIAAMSRNLIEYGLRWIWRPQKIARQIESRDTVVLTALNGSRLVGFAIMHYGDERAHLNLLAVDPDYRSAGLGRRMVEWLEETARVAGVFEVSLEVRDTNTQAREFYKALGYVESSRRRGYYQGIEDAIQMRRNLAVAYSPT